MTARGGGYVPGQDCFTSALLGRVLSLDSPRWAELRTAYGAAADVPDMLRDLESVPNPDDWKGEPWFSIWSALAHQGDVYSASFAAVPHVLRVLASAPERAGFQYFAFPAWVEICRQKTEEPIPDDLLDDYTTSLRQLPHLAAAAADRPWDEPMLQAVLGAIAVTKGPVEVAEAATELTAEAARDFLSWLAEQ